MNKKSAIGIGLLILIALLLFLFRGKPKSEQGPALKTYKGEYVDFTLPANSWACLRKQDASGCALQECHDMNSQRSDLAFVRIQWRPLIEAEKGMDGRYVSLETPMPCGPEQASVPLTEHTTVPILGTDWRQIHLRTDNFDSRFYLNREAGMAIQVEVAVRLGPFQNETTKKLKPLVESLRAHRPGD